MAERAAQQKEHRQNRGDWQQKIIDSRSYQPSEPMTFIDAGIEERTSENEPTPVQSPVVTPKPTPITTPTGDVDPFTKVNTNKVCTSFLLLCTPCLECCAQNADVHAAESHQSYALLVRVKGK